MDFFSEFIPLVMPIDAALGQLVEEQFNSFLLTNEHINVDIFMENSLSKVFDSHARDVYGIPHPAGSCVLL